MTAFQGVEEAALDVGKESRAVLSGGQNRLPKSTVKCNKVDAFLPHTKFLVPKVGKVISSAEGTHFILHFYFLLSQPSACVFHFLVAASGSTLPFISLFPVLPPHAVVMFLMFLLPVSIPSHILCPISSPVILTYFSGIPQPP